MELISLQEQEKYLIGQLNVASSEYAASLNMSSDAQDRARAHLGELSDSLAKNRRDQAALTSSIDEMGAALVETEGLLAQATKGYGELAGATGEAAAATDEQSQAMAALGEAYTQAKTDARESIDSQIGLFDELADKNEWSAEKIIKNWEDQQAAFANYEDNLKKATELGLDETLVAQLSDGSQQSMMILDALVNDTEISVDEINAAFGGLDEAKDSLSGTMADMEAIAAGTYDDMEVAANAAGYDTVAGLAAGIRSNFSIMENAMRDMGKKAQIAFNRTMEIQSPSRVMARAGGYVVAGVVQGVERNSRDLEKAMSELATAGQVAYQDQLDAVAQYPSMMQGVPGYGTSTTNNRSVAYGGINITINAQAGQDAHDIADAVLEELTVRLGQEEAAF